MKNNTTRRRIGIYGGSFNPAHKGHLHVAEQSLEKLKLNEVWLVVSPQNPLKADSTDFEERYASAKKLVDGKPNIIASDIEKTLMKGEAKFYTYNFLLKLTEKFPDTEFVLIIGADNLSIFHNWHNWRAICTHYKIAVFPRAGHNKEAIRSEAYRQYPDSFILVKADEVNISSTELRAEKNL